MRTEFEELVRDSMEWFAADISAPAGMAEKARRQHRQRRLAQCAAATVGAASLAVAAGVLAGQTTQPGAPHTGSGPATVTLTAWTVTREHDGLVTISIRELRDPSRLRQVLRADGVPAVILFRTHPFPLTTAGYLPPGCHHPAMSDIAAGKLQAKIFPRVGAARLAQELAHQPMNRVLIIIIAPSAIPRGIGVSLAAYATNNSLGLNYSLVLASPQCTGQ